ncbi:MAG: hypothetical protein ACLR23_04945 [Clostridia bacterium]
MPRAPIFPGVAKRIVVRRAARGEATLALSFPTVSGIYKGLRDVQEIDTATLSTALQLGWRQRTKLS